MKKLSQTKSAIKRRKQRREETPKQKEIRILKRRIGVARFEQCNAYSPDRYKKFQSKINAAQKRLKELGVK